MHGNPKPLGVPKAPALRNCVSGHFAPFVPRASFWDASVARPGFWPPPGVVYKIEVNAR